jgi:cation transport ATPase
MPPETDNQEKYSNKKNIDVIGKFFERPFFLSFTIGIPFCVFKLLFGATAISVGGTDNSFLLIFGGMVVIWALTDLVMNIGRSALDLLDRPAPFEFCIIAQAGRVFHKPRVFLAIDTLLTFGIICAMLWSGWITKLTSFESYLWYAATTLNLISLSLVAIYHEMQMT